MTTEYVYLKIGSSIPQFEVGIIKGKDSSHSQVLFLKQNREVQVLSQNLIGFRIDQTGDRFAHKVCDRCFRYLKTEQFENNRHKKGGFITKRPSCRACRKIKNGKSISAADKRVWDAKKPQNGAVFACPICKKSSIVGITKIVLDHCHKTGRVRGYVCESCNTGLGRFDDDPRIVQHAFDWLSTK